MPCVTRQRQSGFIMFVAAVLVMMIALTILVSKTEDLVAATGKGFTEGDATLTRIQSELINFVATNRRLPCPADPGGLNNPGWPDGNIDISVAVPFCTYRSGVVPWKALGLTQSDATDGWGRLISYRVYDGPVGLTQLGGSSATNCDQRNSGTPETPPDANGLCNADRNTLESSFLRYPAVAPYTYEKGLTVSDFGTTINNVAYVLISHGPSGLGGYLPDGTRLTMPTATASDFPNTQEVPAQFIKAAFSSIDVAAGTAGHYDDVVAYLKITDLLTLAHQAARDWPEVQFNANTTANMTAGNTDPSNPHFVSSGAAGTRQEFTVSQGGLAVDFGAAAGTYAGCLWWPNKFIVVNRMQRLSLATYVDFASTDNSSDTLPGFTIGFLSGTSSAPSNSTCGTTIAVTTTATGSANQKVLNVADVTGIATGMSVFGNGIPFNATVFSISGSAVTLTANTTSTVSGSVNFANGTQVSRDIGWDGGTLASGYANRFAVEFDATRSTAPTTANDPTNPHLAVDYGGVTHGTNASSCAAVIANGTATPGSVTTSGLACDSEAAAFASVSKTATGSSGQSTITITDTTGMAGILHGMTATYSPTGVIPSSTTVSSVSGNVVTLSKSLTGSVGGVVSFGQLNASNFMQNGISVFHGMRAEVYPKDCVEQTATSGSSGDSTIVVSDSSQIQSGMYVSGLGIANHATVVSVVGTTITLSMANTSAVSGTITFFGASPISTTADGTSGQVTITVASSAGIYVGMAVLGTGIDSSATVAGISGSVITLSAANTQNLSSSAVSFLPARTLVKAWTLSNAGCNLDPIMCTAFKNVSTKFNSVGAEAVSTTATGTAGQTTITVASPSGIARGMIVRGTGISTTQTSGVVVTNVSGTTVTLSTFNSGTVSGVLTFDNRQVMHVVSCVPAATVSNTYDSLYVGLTSSNRTSNAVVSKSATGSKDAKTITVSSATSIGIGMGVRGNGIGDDAFVTNISGTTVTLSAANTSALAGTAVTFAGGENLVFKGLTIGSFALP